MSITKKLSCLIYVAMTLSIIGCDIIYPPEFQLYKAVYENREQDVIRLLNSGKVKDVNPVFDGQTPLHVAARNGNAKIIHELVSHGANVNVVIGDGFSPLDTAAINGSYDATVELIKSGANLNYQDSEFGFTPLLDALRKNRVAVAELLLESGADPCIKNKSGHDALAAGRAYGHQDFIEWYMKHGFPGCG